MNKINLLKNFKIGVFAGGASREREISLKSGEAVFDALNGLGLNVGFFDVTEDNFKEILNTENLDIVFIALHGKFGEDGVVQKVLEDKGILYTGSAPDASLLALDKHLSKKKFIDMGLAVPEYCIIQTVSDVADKKIDFPCVVKPRFEGSSIGLSIVKFAENINEAVRKALECGTDVIIEEYIPGREITVGILNRKVLPIVEIISEKGVYDFTAKYDSRNTKYIVPAKITKEVYLASQQAGLIAHKALGCSGFSRVDLRLKDNGAAYVLEVNTIPGLTERSLLPMAAKAVGISFSELCLEMLAETIGKEKAGI